MIRVLVATGLYPPEIGGPATHIEILEREMKNSDIDLVTVPFALVRGYPKVVRHVMYVYLLLRASRGAAVFYALDPVSVGFPALIASILTRKKLIVRVAGDYAWEQATGRYGLSQSLDEFVTKIPEQHFIVRILAYVERVVTGRAVCVVVPSMYLKGIVSLWGIREERIRVVYNAFTPENTPDHVVARAQLGYCDTVVVSAGRLVPWKGFTTLISVIADLRKEGKTVSLVVIGDGPKEVSLKAYAVSRGVEDHVHFMGRLSKESLALSIAGADVFVLNTGYEGLSHQLLEVMALGVPIVTTTVGGNTELLRDEETGLLVPYEDASALKGAIMRMVTDVVLRDHMVLCARMHAASFTIPRMVSGVRAVFFDMTH